MTKIVFLDAATLGDEIILRPPAFKHTWINFDKTKPSQVVERARDAQVIVTNKVIIDAAMLKKLPDLKHIAVSATGTNCVDLDAAKQKGVSVSNVPGYGTNSVCEHVFAMILSLRRGLAPYKSDIRAGKWQGAEQFCFYNQALLDIKHTTLGIVGTGSIAVEVARIAKAFGMRVIFHSISGRKQFDEGPLLDFSALLKESDVVSVHCPLTELSENLFDSAQFLQMKASALLINTARGSIVNLQALKEALSNKQIGGAGIDVAPNEPPLENDPILALNEMQNCIVTPHTAWASCQAREVLAEQIIKNIEAAQSNESLNIVNK